MVTDQKSAEAELGQRRGRLNVNEALYPLSFSLHPLAFWYYEGRDTRVSQTRSERQTRSFVWRRFAVYVLTNWKCRRRRNVFEQNFLFVAHFVSGKPLCPALRNIKMRVSSKKSFTLLKSLAFCLSLEQCRWGNLVFLRWSQITWANISYNDHRCDHIVTQEGKWQFSIYYSNRGHLDKWRVCLNHNQSACVPVDFYVLVYWNTLVISLSWNARAECFLYFMDPYMIKTVLGVLTVRQTRLSVECLKGFDAETVGKSILNYDWHHCKNQPSSYAYNKAEKVEINTKSTRCVADQESKRHERGGVNQFTSWMWQYCDNLSLGIGFQRMRKHTLTQLHSNSLVGVHAFCGKAHTYKHTHTHTHTNTQTQTHIHTHTHTNTHTDTHTHTHTHTHIHDACRRQSWCSI